MFYAAGISQRMNRKLYLSWMILAIAQFSYAIGDVIWAYYELVLNESPFPSLADGPYVLRYLLFLIGLLILPAAQITSKERIKLVLDTAIVMIASIVLFWTLIIAPTIELSADADELTLLLSVAYPVMDLMLLFALIDLLLRRLGFPGQRALLLLAAGTTFLIVTDSVFNRQSLDGTYISGGMLDNGWIMTYIMVGLAGLSQAEFCETTSMRQISGSRGDMARSHGRFIYLISQQEQLLSLLVWSYDHPLTVPFTYLALA